MKDLFAYKFYLHSVQFDKVDKLVKAIPTVPGIIENPSITIGGVKIVFPVRMESGMYLEFRSSADCKLYGSKGEVIREVIPEGIIPNMATGENEISFSCKGSKGISTLMKVAVISEGKPIVKK